MPSTMDIHHYLLNQAPWVDSEKTVDGPRSGDPNRPLKKAAVCWYPCLETCRKAHAIGCDLLIAHEPLFWEHAREELVWSGVVAGQVKSRLLEDTGLVVLRAHDSWDQWPHCGIRDSWAAFLGLNARVYESERDQGHAYHAVYEIITQSLRTFSAHIAKVIQHLGEDRVQVMGDPDRMIRYVGLGVGCIGPDLQLLRHGAEACIMCYDGASYWNTREMLYEAGAAILTVEHGTTEIPGIRQMCFHLAEVFTTVQFVYLEEHPRPWSVSAGE